MIDLRQTKNYSFYMKSLGWNKEKIGTNFVYLRNLPFLGKIAKLQRPRKDTSEKEVLNFVKQHNLAAFYLEPTKDVEFKSFTFAKSCFLPSKTILIDLQLPDDQLLSQMKHKTRYNIKIAQKNKVIIKKSQNIELFTRLWQEAARRRGMWIPQRKEIKALTWAFGQDAYILFGKHNAKVVAGLLIVATQTTAYYMYAFSTTEGKKLFAPTLLAWEGIKLAKKLGLKTFDFEGIYDERYKNTKHWQGFTRFKEGFGGELVTHPKTLVYYNNIFARLFI